MMKFWFTGCLKICFFQTEIDSQGGTKVFLQFLQYALEKNIYRVFINELQQFDQQKEISEEPIFIVIEFNTFKVGCKIRPI